MAEEKKSPIFSRQSILEKQRIAKEEYDKTIAELRKAFEQVASTPNGKKIFRYLFLLCGGDQMGICRDKKGDLSVNETLVLLGLRSAWEQLRYNFTSETLKELERHNWEDK